MEKKFPPRVWIDVDCQEVWLDEQSTLEPYLSEKEHQALIAPLVEALEDIDLQRKGLKNNWCGMWFDCTECKQIYSKGGNWSVNNQEETDGPCHICRALKALENYRAKGGV